MSRSRVPLMQSAYGRRERAPPTTSLDFTYHHQITDSRLIITAMRNLDDKGQTLVNRMKLGVQVRLGRHVTFATNFFLWLVCWSSRHQEKIEMTTDKTFQICQSCRIIDESSWLSEWFVLNNPKHSQYISQPTGSDTA